MNEASPRRAIMKLTIRISFVAAILSAVWFEQIASAQSHSASLGDAKTGPRLIQPLNTVRLASASIDASENKTVTTSSAPKKNEPRYTYPPRYEDVNSRGILGFGLLNRISPPKPMTVNPNPVKGNVKPTSLPTEPWKIIRTPESSTVVDEVKQTIETASATEGTPISTVTRIVPAETTYVEQSKWTVIRPTPQIETVIGTPGMIVSPSSSGPAWKWYGYGTTTPGLNPYSPSGNYQETSVGWLTANSATNGAIPCDATGPVYIPTSGGPRYKPAEANTRDSLKKATEKAVESKKEELKTPSTSEPLKIPETPKSDPEVAPAPRIKQVSIMATLGEPTKAEQSKIPAARIDFGTVSTLPVSSTANTSIIVPGLMVAAKPKVELPPVQIPSSIQSDREVGLKKAETLQKQLSMIASFSEKNLIVEFQHDQTLVIRGNFRSDSELSNLEKWVSAWPSLEGWNCKIIPRVP
jgi:hypothetical protein